MSSRGRSEEVWKVVSKPPRGQDSVDCPFSHRDDGKECKESLKAPEGSGHVIQKHFDRHHTDWERYKKEPPSILKYTSTASSRNKYSFLSLRQVLLKWFINAGIPFTSIECPEALEVIRRCGEPTRGFSRRGLNSELSEEVSTIEKDLSRFCRNSSVANVSADIWTSSDYRSYVSVIFTTINDSMHMTSTRLKEMMLMRYNDFTRLEDGPIEEEEDEYKPL
jgi:hypothetical protein